MKRTPKKSSVPDKNLHISKKVAGGATGMALGALVAGPVGAIIGGMAGTMVGSAAERGATTNLGLKTKHVARKIRPSARITREGGKAARAVSKSVARARKQIAGGKAKSAALGAQGRSGRRGNSKRR